MKTILLEAINSIDLEEAKSILSRAGPNAIDAKGENGRTALHAAAELGYTQIVTRLIQLGANVNAQDVNLQTPLHLAARACQKEIIDMLCHHPTIQIDLKDKAGKTALYSTPTDRPDIFELILKSGANIRTKPRNVRNMLSFSVSNIPLLTAILDASPNCLFANHNYFDIRVANFMKRNITLSNPKILPLLNARISLTQAYVAVLNQPTHHQDIHNHFVNALHADPILAKQELANIIDNKHLLFIHNQDAGASLLNEIPDLLREIALSHLKHTEPILSSPDPPSSLKNNLESALLQALKYSTETVHQEISALFTNKSTLYQNQDNALHNLIHTLIEFSPRQNPAENNRVGGLLLLVAEKLQQNFIHELNDQNIGTADTDNLQLSTMCLLTRNPQETNPILTYNLSKLISVNTGKNAIGLSRAELVQNHAKDMLNIINKLSSHFTPEPLTALRIEATQALIAQEKIAKTNGNAHRPPPSTHHQIPKLQWVQSHITPVVNKKADENEKSSPKSP